MTPRLWGTVCANDGATGHQPLKNLLQKVIQVVIVPDKPDSLPYPHPCDMGTRPQQLQMGNIPSQNGAIPIVKSGRKRIYHSQHDFACLKEDSAMLEGWVVAHPVECTCYPVQGSGFDPLAPYLQGEASGVMQVSISLTLSSPLFSISLSP